MACRVGMTTNSAERERYWRSRVTGFRNWQILASGLTYHQAQDREAEEARKGGCVHGAGGEYKPGPVWSVYKFEYTSDPGG